MAASVAFRSIRYSSTKRACLGFKVMGASLLKPIMYTAKLCYSQPDFSYDFAQSPPYQCRIIWMRLPSMHTTISCSRTSFAAAINLEFIYAVYAARTISIERQRGIDADRYTRTPYGPEASVGRSAGHDAANRGHRVGRRRNRKLRDLQAIRASQRGRNE